MGEEINRVISGYNNAKDAANYGEALRLEMTQNSGTDYTMVWSVAYSGSFPPGKE